MTRALDAFLANGQDVTALLDLHREKGGDEVGARWGLEVLNKSAIVLICSFWEAYCEDVAAEALDHLVQHTNDPNRLPERLRRSVAEELKADDHDFAVWRLAADGWREILTARMATFWEQRNRLIDNPKSAPVDELFDRTLGLEKISDSWAWKGSSAARTRLTLNKYVSLRGDIAHRGASAKGVRKRDAERFSGVTRRLVQATEVRVIEWVGETVGEPLSGPPPRIDRGTKRCPRCGEVKEVHLFGRRSASPDGLNWTCKACVNGRVAALAAERRNAAAVERLRR